MPRHKKGTLVRAYTKEELGEEKWDFHSADEYIVPNGYLWVVQRFIPAEYDENEFGANTYECKSLATGAVLQLFPEEITTRKERTNGED
jgi:hypothetical protein